MARLSLYTDGGASPNPGPGGWGVVIVDPLTGATEELSGGEPDTTNNRMELLAAIHALENQPDGAQLDVFTDSRYLRQGITQWLAGWRRNNWQKRDGSAVKNVDLWQRLEQASARHDIAWHWLKGHAGHEHNERADQLASEEIDRIRAALPVREHPSGDRSPAELEAFLRVRCTGRTGRWAALLRLPGGDQTIGGRDSPTSANRLALIASLEILEHCPAELSLAIHTNIDYVRNGLHQWVSGWQARGWRTSAGDPVKNAGLWRRLLAEIENRTVTFLRADSDDEELRELGKQLRQSRA